MRQLDLNMKANLIKQELMKCPSTCSDQSSSSRPRTARSAKSDNSVTRQEDSTDKFEEQSHTKKSRPRSLTFTLNKGDQSPSKKQKSGRSLSHGRNKSVDISRSSSSNSVASTSSKIFGKGQNHGMPEDFISYLREVQMPESVEIGRLQKLRQLLRNETVSWVDEFITKGGMGEIVGLLYRIIDIEWRYAQFELELHGVQVD